MAINPAQPRRVMRVTGTTFVGRDDPADRGTVNSGAGRSTRPVARNGVTALRAARGRSYRAP
ncbi:MAG: hypothetical protein ACYDCJ_13010 [Gammaproteobacteria bacterium]